MRYANTATFLANLANAPVDALNRRMMPRTNTYAQENVEIVGDPHANIIGVAFIGGTVGLRLNKCDNFYVGNCSADLMWNPPGGSDGHGFQAINCGGTFHYCWANACDGWGQSGSLGSEDLISIYGDEPATLTKHVIVEMCHTYGRSKSDTCTHICIDGPFPPKVTVLQNRGKGARCYMTIAGGNNHDIQMNASYGADTDCYVVDYYPEQHATAYKVMDGITVVRNTFPNGVLKDTASKFGPHCKFQLEAT